ncbi:MAG: DUF3787 domain-containing protein [Clostridiales bacterium]|nr:DUF3787 domain-containing protein [Clostridiales bacterium]
MEREVKGSKSQPEFKALRGYRLQRDFRNKGRIADVYYNIERIDSEGRVPIPTLDAVLRAKEWVDDQSRL